MESGGKVLLAFEELAMYICLIYNLLINNAERFRGPIKENFVVILNVIEVNLVGFWKRFLFEYILNSSDS